MVTLIVIPNFKGSKIDFLKATITTLLLDSIYLVPMILQYK
jgi:hypothetical protein